MITLIRIILFVVSALFFLGAVLFLLRGVTARAAAAREGFNVARLNAQRTMMRYVYAAGGLLLLGLVFLVSGLVYGGGDETDRVGDESAPAVLEPGVTVTADSEPTGTAAVELVPAEPTATVPPVITTPTLENTPPPPPTVTPEPTEVVERAVVNSPVVGLYLRTAPNGEIIERLEDQAVLILLGEERLVDDLLWLRVQADTGSEGWVAADFLLIGSEIPPPTATAPLIPTVEESETGDETEEPAVTATPDGG